jgi:hypothetical protein
MSGAVTGFKHDRQKSALQNMSRGGEADRAGSDDRDGFCLVDAVIPSY